jgi:hypothetical protein
MMAQPCWEEDSETNNYTLPGLLCAHL